MFNVVQAETYWLNVTNIILGVATLACLLGVGWVIMREVIARIRERAMVTSFDDGHLFVLHDLGITMADGGEKIDGSSERTNESRNDAKK